MRRYGALSIDPVRPMIRVFVRREDRDAWIAQAPDRRRPLTVTERVQIHREQAMASPNKYEPRR